MSENNNEPTNTTTETDAVDTSSLDTVVVPQVTPSEDSTVQIGTDMDTDKSWAGYTGEAGVHGVVFCTDQSIDIPLVRGFEGLRVKFEDSQMALVGTEHRDIYNALTRLFHNFPQQVIDSTLANLFAYAHANKDRHMDKAIVLQGHGASGLDKEAQQEYIKLISIILHLSDPIGRGKRAKGVNWVAFPNGLKARNKDVITRALKTYFNIT